MSSDPQCICIVGAGQAGGELALQLRQQGWPSAIVLIGDEDHPPYQRPPLSKAYLHPEAATASLYLRQQAAYEKANITLVQNSRVERIDLAARTLTLSDGRELHYAKLALTTGGRVRKLSTPDAAAAESARNFLYLRTVDDAMRLRGCLGAGKRLVVIGGGYIGLEVAATAVSLGVKVTVLEALPRVLARVTAPQVSQFYEDVHRGAGVDVRTGVAVAGFEFNAAGDIVTGVVCAGGEVVPADYVLVGVGLIPNTDLAQAAGLAVDNGIVIDEYARTSDPHVVAAGDCACHPCAFSGCRLRLESVANAVEQARVAAATLNGKLQPYDAVPWFWSEQYDLRLQTAGLSRGYDEVVLRGTPSNRSFTAFYLRERRLIASDSVNRPQEFMLAKRLIAARATPDPALLADEATPLKSLAPPPPVR